MSSLDKDGAITKQEIDDCIEVQKERESAEWDELRGSIRQQAIESIGAGPSPRNRKFEIGDLIIETEKAERLVHEAESAVGAEDEKTKANSVEVHRGLAALELDKQKLSSIISASESEGVGERQEMAQAIVAVETSIADSTRELEKPELLRQSTVR